MKEPAELISMSSPAIGMEIVAGSDAGAEKTEQLREWLFTQTVGIRERASSVTMVYAGMADGHFVGCECTPPVLYRLLLPDACLVGMSAR